VDQRKLCRIASLGKQNVVHAGNLQPRLQGCETLQGRGEDAGLPQTTPNHPQLLDAVSRKKHWPSAVALCNTRPLHGRPASSWPAAGRPGRPKSHASTGLREGMQAETHPELGDAVVDAALVLVDVGPGVAGSTKGGDIAFWGLRNAAEPGEHRSCNRAND